MKTLSSTINGAEALTDSSRRPRQGKEKSTAPLSGLTHNRPPVAGWDSPPAKMKTRRWFWIVAAKGEAEAGAQSLGGGGAPRPRPGLVSNPTKQAFLAPEVLVRRA